MKVYTNIIDTVGHTPLVELTKIEKEFNLKGKIYAKVEFFNPGGSIKDRIAKAMLLDALEKGTINKETVIIEPTSGNTGIGLAMVCASLGLKMILTMPETMSIERQKLLKAYGAELVLTEGALGMKGAIAKAEELHKENKNSFIPGQFVNEVNPRTHYLTTGKEILEDLDNKVDVLVAGVGTGGTISGVGKLLKEHNKDAKVIAVEPFGSPVLSTGTAGKHKIQGIGAGFVPDTLDTKIYDEIITVKDEDAMSFGKLIAQNEGILVGISSGAALFAAVEVAKRSESKGKNIVVILPDSGNRYLSTPMFD